ncbi:MAG: cation diffusion facilitator family transporter [Candidatus Kapaibacterium sp.]
MAQKNNTATLRTAWISILVTLILIAAKLFGGLLSGSLALISLATESALDLLAVLLTLFAVRITARPADKDHPYGHGKFDNLSSLFQSLLLLGISFWIFYEALYRLLNPTNVTLNIDYITFGILIGSFILDFWRSRKLDMVGKEVRSQALQTDAIHFLADSLSVAVVFFGLLFSKYLKLAGADSYAAMLVSGFVAVLSIRQGKQAFDVLSDRYDQTENSEKVSDIIKMTSGVHDLEKLQMRHSGPNLFIDATIAINRVLPFASVEHILGEVKDRVSHEFPGAEVNLRSHAIKTKYESTFETIKLIISEEGLLPHNIELSKDEKGAVTLDLHLEFPPASSLGEAHEKSEIIEAHIKEHLPSISKIVLHLEEERPDYTMTVVHDITAARHDFAQELSLLVKTTHPSVKDVRDLILWESQPYKDLKLALTIVVDKSLSLSAAHDIVTIIEQSLRKKYSELARIVIHSEPE